MRIHIKALLAVMVVLVLTMALAACSNQATREADPKERVDKALDDAKIEGVRTEYDKDANVVHLRGTVDNPAEKQRANEVANGAVGTSGRVLDEITVEGADEERADNVDSRIRESLDRRFDEDSVFKERDINFDVNNGVVTIKGEVRSAEEKAKVTQIVRSIPGVKDLANELKIEPKR